MFIFNFPILSEYKNNGRYMDLIIPFRCSSVHSAGSKRGVIDRIQLWRLANIVSAQFAIIVDEFSPARLENVMALSLRQDAG